MKVKQITDSISGILENESFSVAMLDHIPSDAGRIYRPDHNLILFITGGNAVAKIDGEITELSQSGILLISKGQIYSIQHNAQGYLLKFGNCFWDKTPISASNCKAVLFDSNSVNRRFELREEDKIELGSIFEAILNDYEGQFYSNKADAIAAYLKIIIIKIANIHSLLQLNIAQHDTRVYQRFIMLVQQDFKKERNVSKYADKLGLSPRKLHDVCRAAGVGAKEIISGEVVSEAKRLLQFTTLSIKEISASLGFSTSYQFSAYFKKSTGISPVRYKVKFVESNI